MLNRLFILLLLVSPLFYSQVHQNEYGDVEIALIEHNPLLITKGNGIPTFALYKSGYVIYRDIVKNKIYSYKLSKTEKEKLINSFSITDSLLSLPAGEIQSGDYERPYNQLLLNLSEKKTITVDGSLRNNPEQRNNAPKSFLHIYDKIIGYKTGKAKEWIPKTLEVKAWDFSYSSEEPLEWPKGWPDINTPETTNNDGLYTIHLTSKHYKKLITILETLSYRQGIKINDNIYGIDYMVKLPGF